jgi:Phage Mu protein F like protein
MLINVRSDAKFQKYLDQEEQRLHVKMFPVLVAGIRIQVNTNALRAQMYVEERGQPILFDEYRRIYRDQYNAVSEQVTKRAEASDFVVEQTRFLLSESSRRITNISTSLREEITKLMLNGVAEGKSNNQITRELRALAPEIGKKRSATIARTETHNASLAAIEESLKFKSVKVNRKTWWTAQDKRVRESHRDVHGVTVDFDKPFDVGDAQMMRPGDQSLGAGAEEVVNCRCAVLYETAPYQPPPEPPPPPPPEPAPAPVPVAPPRPPEEINWHEKSWTDAPDYIIAARDKTPPLKEVVTDPSTGSAFYPDNAKITMRYPDKSALDAQLVWRHEFGHHWDREQGRKVGSHIGMTFWSQRLEKEADADNKALNGMLRSARAVSYTDLKARVDGHVARYHDHIDNGGATELVAMRRVLSEIFTTSEFTADDFINLIVRRDDRTFIGNPAEAIRAATILQVGEITGALQVINKLHPDASTIHKVTHTADYLGALTRNKIGWGHMQRGYYSRGKGDIDGMLQQNQGTEMVANYFSMSGERDPFSLAAVRLLKWLAPKTWAAIDRAVKAAAT